MKRVAACAAALALCGCAVQPDPERIGPYPSDYKAAVKGAVEKVFFDPYSMRSVGITAPQQGHLLFQQGWVVCFRANAKNRMGGYVGVKQTAFLINRDKVVDSMADAPMCDGQYYQPWPEMEGK